MQRCLVQWVSSGKKPSGHPADRGMACWRDACCSRTERGASGGRGPRYRGSRWILAPLLDRKPHRCHAVPLRACVRSALVLRSREKFTYGARAATDQESTSRCWPSRPLLSSPSWWPCFSWSLTIVRPTMTILPRFRVQIGRKSRKKSTTCQSIPELYLLQFT